MDEYIHQFEQKGSRLSLTTLDSGVSMKDNLENVDFPMNSRPPTLGLGGYCINTGAFGHP
jgi:hypothetical protein